MPTLPTFDLPISGMTCASCAGRVERALRGVPEVSGASVNLASEHARVEAPAEQLPALVAAVHKAGYEVPTESLDLSISGMTCASCVGRVERALSRQPGVLAVSVNLATERARVQAVTGIDAQALLNAVSAAGYSASPVDKPQMNGDANDRRLHAERWRLALALLLAAPLVLPMLLAPFGMHVMLPAWAQFLLATPVQFVLGARFYRAAWSALRSGSGNMDQLVALGTSAGYGLSVYQWASTLR